MDLGCFTGENCPATLNWAGTIVWAGQSEALQFVEAWPFLLQILH
jgi:hypothetical protein